MPIKKVEVHQIIHNGKNCFRVIIPIEIGGGGRRFFKNKTDAADFANDLQQNRRGSIGEFLALSVSDQASVIRSIRLMGDRVSELEDAAAAFLRIRRTRNVTIGAALADFAAAKKVQGIAAISLRSVLSTVERFVADLGANLPTSSITQMQIVGWFAKLKTSTVTYRSYLTNLVTFFNWCVANGLLVENPCKDLKKPRYVRRETKILSIEDCAKLMEAARKTDPGLIPFIALGLFGGVRPDEAAHLTGANIKEANIEIPGDVSKTRQRRLVEKKANLDLWLKLGGELPLNNPKLRMEKLRKVAGIVWPADALRHSFASYSVALFGCAETSLQCGHSEAILKQHYLECVSKETATAFFALSPVTTPAIVAAAAAKSAAKA